MQLARGSWLVIGIITTALVLGTVAKFIRPTRPPRFPATTQTTTAPTPPATAPAMQH